MGTVCTIRHAVGRKLFKKQQSCEGPALDLGHYDTKQGWKCFSKNSLSAQSSPWKSGAQSSVIPKKELPRISHSGSEIDFDQCQGDLILCKVIHWAASQWGFRHT